MSRKEVQPVNKGFKLLSISIYVSFVQIELPAQPYFHLRLSVSPPSHNIYSVKLNVSSSPGLVKVKQSFHT